jgi:hypothetical protein
VWDPTSGFGLKNFSGSNLDPIVALSAALARVGLSWNLSEKLLFFWPAVVLSAIGPWLFARRLLGSSRWAVLSAVLFASNTYILMVERQHLTVVVADALAPIVLLAFLEAVRGLSLRWALLCGLLLSAQAAFDVRIAYLTGGLALLYLAVLAITDARRGLVVRRGGLSVVIAVVFALTQAYWWLPFIAYHGDHGLPIASAPWLAFMRLVHGITAVHPFWTGAQLVDFHVAPLNPIYFVLPLFAFVPLLVRRKLSPEVLWLALAALAAAFLIKQTNPPFGQVYTWMFERVPGWNLFREASKLFLIVALAYSVLIPMGLRMLLQTHPKVGGRAPWMKLMALVGLACAAIVGGGALIPLAAGELGVATVPTPMPRSFETVATLIDEDRGYGPTLWLGGPLIWTGGNIDHWFAPSAAQHPLVSLTGTPDSDPFASFCDTPAVSFCYLNDRVFPYLLKRTGAAFVVAPVGDGVGRLPDGVVRGTLLSRLADVLGPWQVIDDGAYSLAVWRLPTQDSPVVTAKALAVVEESTRATSGASPALEALGVPAIFDASGASDSQDGSSPMVPVLPRINNGYRAGNSGQYAILARHAGSAVQIRAGDLQPQPATLGLLTSPPGAVGWSVYGPFQLTSGLTTIEAATSTELGPVIGWSPLTASILGIGPSEADAPLTSMAPEELSANGNVDGPTWIEFTRTYDAGWHLSGATSHLIGDGLFNLYYLPQKASGAAAAHRVLQLSFSTLPWERVGLLLTFAGVLVAVLSILMVGRGQPRAVIDTIPQNEPLTAAIDIAVAGIILIGLAGLSTAIAWSGIGTHLAGVPILSDPVGASDFYAAIAVAFLTIAILLRLVTPSVLRLRMGKTLDWTWPVTVSWTIRVQWRWPMRRRRDRNRSDESNSGE